MVDPVPQGEQQVGGGPHPIRDWFSARVQWLTATIQQFEEPFKALGKVTGFALLGTAVGWIVTSVVQYNSFRVGNDLKRYEQDLGQATKTFADGSNAMSKVLTLQQQVVYNFIDAAENAASAHPDPVRAQFLWTQAHTVIDDYRKARTELRETVGVMTRQTEMYIDWPAASGKDPDKSADVDAKKAETKAAAKDPLAAWKFENIAKAAFDRFKEPQPDASHVDRTTIEAVGANEIDCDATFPKGAKIEDWEHADPVSKKGTVTIDWRSTKHHLIVMYACFAQDHESSEPIRDWASQDDKKTPPTAPSVSAFLPSDPDKRRNFINLFKTHFDLQQDRLEKFNLLAMTQIEKIRFNNEPPGLVCYSTGFWCGAGNWKR